MTSTKRDKNSVPVITGLSDSNGTTVLPFYADPITHALIIDDGTSGTDRGDDHAGRDDNEVPTALAASSSDGASIVPIYTGNSTNAMKVNSN